MKNGSHDIEEDKDWRPHLQKVREINEVVQVIDKAANALREAGRYMAGISIRIAQVETDTARAISDTVELKKHLVAITAREQVVQTRLKEVSDRELVVLADLADIRSLLPKKRRKKFDAQQGKQLRKAKAR
jgi:hypothetical protein